MFHHSNLQPERRGYLRGSHRNPLFVSTYSRQIPPCSACLPAIVRCRQIQQPINVTLPLSDRRLDQASLRYSSAPNSVFTHPGIQMAFHFDVSLRVNFKIVEKAVISVVRTGFFKGPYLTHRTTLITISTHHHSADYDFVTLKRCRVFSP